MRSLSRGDFTNGRIGADPWGTAPRVAAGAGGSAAVTDTGARGAASPHGCTGGNPLRRSAPMQPSTAGPQSRAANGPSANLASPAILSHDGAPAASSLAGTGSGGGKFRRLAVTSAAAVRRSIRYLSERSLGAFSVVPLGYYHFIMRLFRNRAGGSSLRFLYLCRRPWRKPYDRLVLSTTRLVASIKLGEEHVDR